MVLGAKMLLYIHACMHTHLCAPHTHTHTHTHTARTHTHRHIYKQRNWWTSLKIWTGKSPVWAQQQTLHLGRLLHSEILGINLFWELILCLTRGQITGAGMNDGRFFLLDMISCSHFTAPRFHQKWHTPCGSLLLC